jgi:phage protein U
MLFQLGDYVFEGLKLPQSWSISFATNYAQIPIISGKPVVQKLGEKLVEHDLSVLFSDEFCTPLDEINSLQAYRRNGNVLQLTGGDGQNYGRYVITEISQVNERANDATGYISAISASIKLLEYNSTATTSVNAGIALKRNNITPIAPKTPSLTQSADLQKSLSKGIEKANSASAGAKSLDPAFDRIAKLCAQAKASIVEANNKIQQTKKILSRAAEFQTCAQIAGNALEDVKAAAQVHSLSDLTAANTVLERAMYNLTGAAAPISAFIGSREGGI